LKLLLLSLGILGPPEGTVQQKRKTNKSQTKKQQTAGFLISHKNDFSQHSTHLSSFPVFVQQHQSNNKKNDVRGQW
jgi:ABC-type transport system involved in cytochrome c biogenesis ATPase subunit